MSGRAIDVTIDVSAVVWLAAVAVDAGCNEEDAMVIAADEWKQHRAVRRLTLRASAELVSSVRARALRTEWCKHCGADRRARKDGLCNPCGTYLWKYKVLPPEGVLVKRQRRRDEQRMAVSR